MCCSCRKLKQGLTKSFLLICNTVDIAGGFGIMVYGAYLAENNYAPSNIATGVAILGASLLLVGISSWAGMQWPLGCSHALLCSSYMCLPVAIFEVIMAIVMLSSTSSMRKYMADHDVKEDVQNEVSNPALPIFLFGFSIMEFLRFYSSHFLGQSTIEDAKKERLLRAEEQEENRRIQQEKNDVINDRYSGLRDKFKNKYGMKLERTEVALTKMNQSV